jgi:hypothetical protein
MASIYSLRQPFTRKIDILSGKLMPALKKANRHIRTGSAQKLGQLFCF